MTVTRAVSAIHQRSSFDITASLGDGAYTAGNYRLGTASTSHSKVHMVLRTPTIYFDSDAVVVKVWTAGPGFDSISSSSIHFMLTNEDNKERLQFNCGKVSSLSGRDCKHPLGKSSWFSTTKDVPVSIYAVMTNTQHRSKTAQFKLAKRPKAN